MMTEINADQARALAALVATLRPEWDLPGIRKALWDAKTRAGAWDVAHAALHAARDPKNRTPAVIPMVGTHWVASKPLGEAGAIRYPRCEEPGHQSFAAHNCSACRSEQLEFAGTDLHSRRSAPPVPREALPPEIRRVLAAVRRDASDVTTGGATEPNRA